MMGHPKFPRRKYETPLHPWQEDRIRLENALIKKYGLKNNREVWKTETNLRRYRGQARALLAKIDSSALQVKKETDQLLNHLIRMNILSTNSSLDDVLALNIESILSRRLQTIIYLKGLAGSPHQARQFISHGHISIDNRSITIPSYMVTKDEEDKINYTSKSPLTDAAHPARPAVEFDVKIKPSPLSKEDESKARKKESKIDKKDKGKKSEPDNTIKPDEDKKIEHKAEKKDATDRDTNITKSDNTDTKPEDIAKDEKQDTNITDKKEDIEASSGGEQ